MVYGRKENTTVEQWTERPVKNVEDWTDCRHRRTEYFLTQFLTGHGTFGDYEVRLKNKKWYCGNDEFPEQHTIYNCGRWERKRTALELDIGVRISLDDTIDLMINNIRNWNKIHSYVKAVLPTKQREERGNFKQTHDEQKKIKENKRIHG
ncbi:hypothetical protein JTB14_013748 [Gonioctena quinquepunctata]|nr:hypothetical protein JTB14_013748 [Gonioctena quinquepunctata]